MNDIIVYKDFPCVVIEKLTIRFGTDEERRHKNYISHIDKYYFRAIYHGQKEIICIKSGNYFCEISDYHGWTFYQYPNDIINYYSKADSFYGRNYKDYIISLWL